MLQRIIICLFCVLLTACVAKQQQGTLDNRITDVSFNRDDAAKARLDLALSYLNQNNFQQAKLNLDKALTFAPHLAEVHYSRAYYFQTIGEDSLARQHYHQAFKLAPNNPDVQHNYGSFLCTRGEYEKAKDLLIAASKSPNYTQAGNSYLNLAYCSIELGYFSAALNYLKLANRHMPRSVEVILMVAGLNFSLGKDSNALDWYQRYVNLALPEAKGALLGWLIFQEVGLSAKAQSAKLFLLQRFPDSLEAALLQSGQASQSEFGQLRQRVEQLNLLE